MAAHSYGIDEVIVVVNKSDLPETPPLLQTLSSYYGSRLLNCKLLAVSCQVCIHMWRLYHIVYLIFIFIQSDSHPGLEELRKALDNRTSLLVGQSGVVFALHPLSI